MTMDKRRPIRLLSLCVLLVASGCAGPLAFTADKAADDQDRRQAMQYFIKA